MDGTGEGSHPKGSRVGPVLRPGGEHKREPVGRNGGVEESDPEAGDRDRGQDGIVHLLVVILIIVIAIEHEHDQEREHEKESIGLAGFEPAASSSRTKRSTKLSHSPFCEGRKLGGAPGVVNAKIRECSL